MKFYVLTRTSRNYDTLFIYLFINLRLLASFLNEVLRCLFSYPHVHEGGALITHGASPSPQNSHTHLPDPCKDL